MKRLAFISWIAVSSRPQAEKESPQEQRNNNREYVENLTRYYPGYNGYIVTELEVVGSRSITELSEACDIYPEQYGEMVRLIRSRAVDGVICRARDRLGRRDSLIITIERLCLEHGVVVLPRQSPPISLDAHFLRESAGTGIHAAVDGHMAQFYIMQLVANHKMGMFNRVVERKKFPNMLPWGYRYRFGEDGARQVEIDPAAAEVVRFLLIDCLLHQRLGRMAIAEALNTRGYKTAKGLEWNEGSVENIVKNAWHYSGLLRVNGHSKTGRVFREVQGEHPPILSQEEWEEIQQEIASRKPTRISRVRPFAGCVICVSTGQLMSGDCTSFRNKEGERYLHYSYQCNRCEHTHSIAQHRVIAAVRVALELLDTTDDLASLLPPADIDTHQIERRIKEIRQSLNELEAKKSRLINMFISRTDIPQSIFDAQMSNIGQQENSLQHALLDEQAKLKAEQDRESALLRLKELKEVGVDILDKIDTEPEVVQKMMFNCLRIYVEHDGTRGRGGNMAERTWVSEVKFIS